MGREPPAEATGMQLAIFGGTGQTGRHLVEQALAQGHRVAALAREPARLDLIHDRLTIVQGDVRDAQAVAQTIAGAGAVLSVLGPSDNTPTFAVTKGMDNILAAMQAHGVRRLILSTGAGVRDPQDRPTLLHAFFGALVKVFSTNVYQDMRRLVDTVRASDVDWTIVRVPMLTDGPRTGQVWSGYVGQAMGTRLTRADLAAYMLSQLTDLAHVRQAPAISNP
jgi:putative NADH-flavin reductase